MFTFLHRTARRVILPLLDFFYPPVCLSCNKLMADGLERVCEECWSSIRTVHKDLELYQETRGKLLASGGIDDLAASFVFEQ